MKRIGWALVIALLSMPLPLSAQTACEDRVRELAVYADAVARSRSRAELDGSKAIADLLKERDELRKEVERLRKGKEGR